MNTLTAAEIATETGIPVRSVQRLAAGMGLGKAAGKRLRLYSRGELRKIASAYAGKPGNPGIAEQAQAGAAARWAGKKKVEK